MAKKFNNLFTSSYTSKPNVIDWASFFIKQIRNNKYSVPSENIIPSQQALLNFHQASQKNTLTWLGHDAFLLRLQNKIILTDPFLSEYASPVYGFGPKRSVPPAIAVDQLPPIDIITVSHDHYDHLDKGTLSRLPNKQSIQVVVPLKMGNFFRKLGYSNISELDWYQTQTIDDIRITALPAIHFARRSLWDTNKTLWASFCYESNDLRIYFSGDTAYGELFKDIAKRYPTGFDYALLDIGAYEPRKVLGPIHINPEEAVQIGKDIMARNLVAMHWGTIKLSHEPLFEPPERFLKAGLAQGYRSDNLWRLKIGETRPLEVPA